MPSFDSFLNPQRRPHAKFRLAGFSDEFEMKVVSREEEPDDLLRKELHLLR